jgi:hypothetical protein
MTGHCSALFLDEKGSANREQAAPVSPEKSSTKTLAYHPTVGAF